MRNRFRTTLSVLLVALIAAIALPLRAESLPRADVIDVPAIGEGLCVSNLFQTNMVVQRDKPIAVWGWAAPGEKVTVKFGANEASATAGDDRAWKATLPAVPANHEPQTMTIAGKDKTLTLENILVGDVWVLGGQSNMEFSLASVQNGPLEIASANFPEMRILTVPYGEGPEMKKGFARLQEYSSWFSRHFRKGDWDVCTPDVARELSAIGYVFARRLYMASRVPIGVIDASRGGTTVEAWTPLPVLRKMDSALVKANLAEHDAKVAEWDPKADLEKRIQRNRDWVEKQTKAGKTVPDDRKKDPSDLQPGPIASPNYPGNCYAGIISPLAGLSVKGAIFHQGFNNAFEGSVGAARYREVFPQMIKAWREAFGDPEMPFGILSLCTSGDPQTRDNYCEKMFDAGVYIRAAQYDTFLEMYKAGDKNIGFASTFDLRRSWYHPQVKVPAGERIARWALATQYGLDRLLDWKPPMIIGTEATDGALIVKLDTDVSDPESGEMVGFAIAGEDGRFQLAKVAYLETGKDDHNRPKYDRKQLVLSSPLVPKPIHYRYAWGRSPLANIQVNNNKDIPLATQRSDDWPLEQISADAPVAEEPVSRGDRGKIIQELRDRDLQRRLFEARQLIESNK
ncbi:MAG: hypothetical protein GC159_18060 [Phycisphaera sp.]|nr:hypothetical protein [Phycisphaera sp.]